MRAALRNLAPTIRFGGDDEVCPFCSEYYTLTQVSTNVTISPRNGGPFIIPDYTYTYCEKCSAEFVTLQQSQHNDEVKFRETESN